MGSVGTLGETYSMVEESISVDEESISVDEETYSVDEESIVRTIRTLVGELSDDEAALVRTLTAADVAEGANVEHIFDLMDLLASVRSDEAIAEYVYAIAPKWDGTIEALLLAGRVTTAFARYELERRAPAQV
jgi:hypothetical protein